MNHKQWISIVLGFLMMPCVAFGECNTAPTANPDTVIVLDLSPAFIMPLSNDSDGDGDALTVEISEECLGSISELGDGSLMYQGLEGRGEVCMFDYTIADGRGGSATSSITIDATALTTPEVFADGFESGDTSQW